MPVFQLSRVDDLHQCRLQLNARERVSVKGSVMSVSMLPGDGETVVKDPPRTDRQRNEVRVCDPALCIEPAKGDAWGEWTLSVKYDQAFVSPAFQHLVQVKADGVARALFSVGFKGNALVVYRNQNTSPSYQVIAPAPTKVGKYIRVRVRVDVASKQVRWVVDGTSGSHPIVDATGDAEMYLKMGIYRGLPNPITKPATAEYTDISFRKG